MADELKIMPRVWSQMIRGSAMQYEGAHIRPATAVASIDAGNSQTYTVPDGVNYLELTAAADIWIRISADGSDAVVDQDEFLPSSSTIQRGEIIGAEGKPRQIRGGDVVKCVLES